MWVNTALSCRICHIMPSRICHSFFMPSQGAIFVSTCILSAGKCYGNYMHKNVERRRQYKWQCKNPQILKNETGAGRRRRAFHHDSRLVATLIDDCHTESNRLESWNTNKKKLASLSVPLVQCNDKISIQGRLHWGNEVRNDIERYT